MEKELPNTSSTNSTESHISLTNMSRVKKFYNRNFIMVFGVTVLAVGTMFAFSISQQRTELASKASSSAVTIPVLEDAYVSSSKPTKNYGDDNEVKADEDKAVYLKFDLGALSGKPVYKATLRIYVTNSSKSIQLIKGLSDSSWNESTLTYDNRPKSGDVIGQVANTNKKEWKDLDITPYVSTNAGKVISLIIDASKDNKNNLYFDAKGGANAPVIVVQTNQTSDIIATVVPTTTVLSQAPTQTATLAPTSGAIITVPPTVVPTYSGGARNISVTNGAELQAALDNAQPGDAITLANGIYTSKGTSVMVGNQNASAKFRLIKSGTAGSPIVIQGTRNAIINGGGTGGDYGLHLFNANYVTIKGITIAQAKKGLIVDGGNHNIIDNVEVKETGQEGIHLRSFSNDNKIMNSNVHHTGQDKTGAISDQYGEGIYVGTANSNWGTYTGGKVDISDRNEIIDNVISYTGGEGIDIKEGTSNGKVIGNSFDNAGIGGGFSDSWMDVKGNGWTITGNKGTNALNDGYQIHGVYSGWGNNNTLSNNTATSVKGYGFWVQNNVTGNKINCNNTAPGAPSGLANVPCSN